MKTLIPLMNGGIAKKHTLFRPGFQFVMIVWFKKRKASTAKDMKHDINRQCIKKKLKRGLSASRS
jgi:hypothetical protein